MFGLDQSLATRRNDDCDIFRAFFSRLMTRSAGRIRRFTKARGSSRVGSGGVGNLTGRVASGQEVFTSQGSGPGRLDPVRPARSDLAREKPWIFSGVYEWRKCAAVHGAPLWSYHWPFYLT